MGAKGIVEIDNELKIIFGDDAKQLKKNIGRFKSRRLRPFFIDL